MKDDLKDIARQIKSLFDYTIYPENVPQNFKSQSFFIELVDEVIDQRLGNRYEATLTYSITFFSSVKTKTDVINHLSSLLRELKYINSKRIISKSMGEISDDVGNITFQVRCREIQTSLKYDKIDSVQINMKNKKEMRYEYGME